MTTTFLSEGVWPEISKSAKKNVGQVAVAYLGKNAQRILPLRSGSLLVVDASEGAVKSGQTSPMELRGFLDRGVEIYTARGLHAKVFVFGRRAIIGSSNATTNSSSTLIEAAVLTTDPSAVSGARRFVESLAGERLEADDLRRLSGLYNPPVFLSPMASRDRESEANPAGPYSPLWIAPVEFDTRSEDARAAERKGRPHARQRIKSGDALDDFQWSGASLNKLRDGDIVIQRIDKGRGIMFDPPGHIVRIQHYFDREEKADAAIVFMSVPGRNGKHEKRVRALLGRTLFTPLTKIRSEELLRVRNPETVRALLQLW